LKDLYIIYVLITYFEQITVQLMVDWGVKPYEKRSTISGSVWLEYSTLLASTKLPVRI